MSIPRRDPNFTMADLQAAADKWMDAGYEYWVAAAKAGINGAVIWVADTDGRMSVFTRGEYRQTILQNIDRMGQAREFGKVDP